MALNQCDPHLTAQFPRGIVNRRNALRQAGLFWGSFIIAFPLPAASSSAPEGAQARANTTKDSGKLYDFKIARPNFVVEGANLSKVEVWSWPTGTGVTKPTLIGTARRITDPGEREKWILRIPPDLLAVEIFATAFDKAGRLISRKSAPYKGASAVYEALYGKK